MKKTVIVSLLLTLFNLNSIAQTYLVKNDGEVISFTKNKIKKDVLIVTTPFQKKLEINVNQIEGYYSLASNTMYYLKPIVDNSSWGTGLEFVQRIVEGKINVYTKTISSYSGGGPGQVGNSRSNTYLYLEKGDEYFNILTTGTIGQNKNEKIDKFISIVLFCSG